MTVLPWRERVPMLMIHPQTASADDVANLASELMDAHECLAREQAECATLRAAADESAALVARARRINTALPALVAAAVRIGFAAATPGGPSIVAIEQEFSREALDPGGLMKAAVR